MGFRFLRAAALALLALACGPLAAEAQVIQRLPTSEKVVALTFDACESVTPATLDHGITDYLNSRRLPYTMFVSGRFARHNGAEIAALAKLPFVEIENHSENHPQHMERLAPGQVKREVMEAHDVLASLTGRAPRYFRFPAGNHDSRTLAEVEGLGYRVVHWDFPSGDPDRSVTAAHLTQWVGSRTRPGSILIFHANGRGWRTAEALPRIVEGLEKKGYRFVRLDRMLP